MRHLLRLLRPVWPLLPTLLLVALAATLALAAGTLWATSANPVGIILFVVLALACTLLASLLRPQPQKSLHP